MFSLQALVQLQGSGCLLLLVQLNPSDLLLRACLATLLDLSKSWMFEDSSDAEYRLGFTAVLGQSLDKVHV